MGLGRTGALTRQVTTQKIYHGTHETHENQRRSDATLMAEKNITVGEESFLPSSCLSFHFVGFVGTSYCMDTLSASADISCSKTNQHPPPCRAPLLIEGTSAAGV